MAERTNTLNSKMGTYLQNNGVEEERPIAVLNEDDSKSHSQKYRHKGIFAVDQDAKMETITTSKATYIYINNPGVRLKGARRELLEKHLTQMISEKVREEQNPPPPKTEFSSTTSKDFCAQGFVPRRPHCTKARDYRTDQAITFWSENHQRIQGVTPVKDMNAPFRKSTLFSTPITERLDDPDPPSDI